MAYNNMFPATYQPMAYNPQQFQSPQFQQAQPQSYAPQSQAAPVQQGSIIWVSGEAGAKSYLLVPNTTLPLWDSESNRIYLKSADASGMPSIKILEYSIKDGGGQSHAPAAAEPKTIGADYVTRDELKDFERKMTHKIDGLLRKEDAHESDADIADAGAGKK